jgi:hypothetical protein
MGEWLGTTRAYLDASGNVLAAPREYDGVTYRTLAQFQAEVDDTATEVVVGAPGEVRPKQTGVLVRTDPNNLGDQYQHHQRTTGDGTEIGHYTLADDLDRYKSLLMGLCDEYCESKIVNGPGFEWPVSSGQCFSLSSHAQVKWNGMLLAKDSFDYVNDPPKVRTKDDLVEYTISSAADLQGMWDSAMSTVRTFLDDGRQCKADILAASTPAAAKAVLDAYMA